jgi:hypothetical protein
MPRTGLAMNHYGGGEKPCQFPFAQRNWLLAQAEARLAPRNRAQNVRSAYRANSPQSGAACQNRAGELRRVSSVVQLRMRYGRSLRRLPRTVKV